MDAIRARARLLVAFAAVAFGGAVAWGIGSVSDVEPPVPETRCAPNLRTQLERLTTDQLQLDAKIEDVIGQLSFATTHVEREAARERLAKLHGEALDLHERAGWLQRLQLAGK